MKICKNGHDRGTVATCKCCKASNSSKQAWAENYERFKARSKANMAGLDSDTARKKRAAYFSSDLHKQRAAETGRKLAEERRLGLRMRLSQSKTQDTKPELATRQVLDELQLHHIPQYQVGPYHFDFGLPDHKALIEVQGEYWHSLQNNIANDLAKESYVRSQHPDFKIIYITELDAFKKGVIEKIIIESLNVTQTQRDIDVNQIEVLNVDADLALDFLAKKHYLPRFRKSMRFVHGIYLGGGELIGILVYASPSYNTIATRHGLAAKNVLELARLVVKNDCHIMNLISKAMSLSIKLIKQYKDICLLVSYADPHFGHDGSVYKSCNWITDGTTPPSYYYAGQDGSILHKKTVWDHASKMKMKEQDYADISGLRRINTEPKNRFLYRTREATDVEKKAILNNEVVCKHCGLTAMVSANAHYRSTRKHGGSYVCLPCSIQQNWIAGIYEGRPKRTDADKRIKVEVQCKCGKQQTIQQKTLDGVIKKHGEYKCMGCIIRAVHKNGHYTHLKKVR